MVIGGNTMSMVAWSGSGKSGDDGTGEGGAGEGDGEDRLRLDGVEKGVMVDSCDGRTPASFTMPGLVGGSSPSDSWEVPGSVRGRSGRLSGW